jgi:hypothetical protein
VPLSVQDWRAFHRFTTPIEISSRPRSIDRGGNTIQWLAVEG